MTSPANLRLGARRAELRLASNELPAGLTPVDVITYAYEATQGVVNRYRLAGSRPTSLITVPKDACRTLIFQRAAPMVELGRELTADALEAFEARPAPTPSSPSSTCQLGGRCA